MSENIWYYSLIGICNDFRGFISSLDKSLLELDSSSEVEFNLIKNINPWEFVSKNCYGNFVKDDNVLSNIQVIVINYDEISSLVSLHVSSCSQSFKTRNREYMAKEILKRAADLLQEPEHWITAFNKSSSYSNPTNFFVKKVSVPAVSKDFDVEEEMYSKRTDSFGKEIPLVEGYKSMFELVSESGDFLVKDFNLLAAQGEEDAVAKITELFHKDSNELYEKIKEPYDFFELEFKPINATATLINDAGLYIAEYVGYNYSKYYNNVPPSLTISSLTKMLFPTICMYYSKDHIDFISLSCQIEKDVLGDEIENDLKINRLDSIDEFFSD